jgi:phage shock protein PspC (stress-responsive transcriptional regulator)
MMTMRQSQRFEGTFSGLGEEFNVMWG